MLNKWIEILCDLNDYWFVLKKGDIELNFDSNFILSEFCFIFWIESILFDDENCPNCLRHIYVISNKIELKCIRSGRYKWSSVYWNLFMMNIPLIVIFAVSDDTLIVHFQFYLSIFYFIHMNAKKTRLKFWSYNIKRWWLVLSQCWCCYTDYGLKLMHQQEMHLTLWDSIISNGIYCSILDVTCVECQESNTLFYT